MGVDSWDNLSTGRRVLLWSRQDCLLDTKEKILEFSCSPAVTMIEYVSVTASFEGGKGEGYISIGAEEAGLECPKDLTHKGTSAYAALIVSLMARVLSCSLRAQGTGDPMCPF